MKPRLLAIICCPACSGGLTLETFAKGGSDAPGPDEIMEGRLSCHCGADYPVVAGVPRLLRGALLAECLYRHHSDFLARHRARFLTIPPPPAAQPDRKVATMRAFGYQWTTFVDNFGYYRDIFLSFVRPYLSEGDFAGKLVLEAGCGSGRPASVAASLGAEVVAVDLSEAVQTAFSQTQRFPKLHVVQGDIYALPFKPCFDFVYSVGVLQHLPVPADAVRSIARVVPQGRKLVLWVYGQREWWYQPIEWLRGVTRRLPHRLLHALSWLLAVASELLLLLPYRILSRVPLTSALAERIPGRIYARFPFRENVIGWFDRLGAPVTYYFSRADIETMLRVAGFGSVEITARPDASASWVVQAIREDRPVVVDAAAVTERAV